MRHATTVLTGLDGTSIPPRPGPRPHVRPGTPHQQLDQLAPPPLQEALWSRMVALPYVRAGGSVISLPDTRALHLAPAVARGPREAFAPDGGTEFAHLHGVADGSLHMNLPPATAAAAIAAGWAEWHPVVIWGWVPRTLVMIYGPRDPGEVDIVFDFVRLSHAFASGSA